MDIWLGSLKTTLPLVDGETLTGILCTFDTLKRDAEIKLLIRCTSEEVEVGLNFHGEMQVLFIPNPKAKNEFP